MLFELSAEDNHQAILMGNDTVRLCEMQGIKPRMTDKKGLDTRRDNNIRAFKAEFLFARLFNLDPPKVNVGSDGGVDFWLGEYSIDVKCSGKPSGPLIFDSPASFQADIAVAYSQSDINDRTFNLHGMISKGNFLRKARRHDFGYGERHVVDVDQLELIEKLWRFYIEKTVAKEEHGQSERTNLRP